MKQFFSAGAIAMGVAIVPVNEHWSAPRNQTSPPTRNERLQAGSAPFEHVSELAAAGDWNGVARELGKFQLIRHVTLEALPPLVRTRFESELAAIEASHRTRDACRLAAHAADAYRTLVAAQNTSLLRVPLEVSLLDYAGFKAGALLGRCAPDWRAVETASADARRFWAALRPQMRDAADLRTLTSTVVSGFSDAAGRRDRAGAQFAARVMLDLVDVLEGHFASRAAPR